MICTSRRAVDIQAAAAAWDFQSAEWHAQQLVYWRGQLGHSGAVPARRCAAHVQRHERRVVEIAERSLASLAVCTPTVGAAA